MKNNSETREEPALPHTPSKNNQEFTKLLLNTGLILLLFSLITVTIILGSVPPVDRDALTHHLFIPKLWLQHGMIYEIPEISFSYYPMNLDLLYTIPLYFGNDIIPKYFHYSFALLTGGLIFWYLKKRLGSLYALLGVIFFLSTPAILKLSFTVYVDLGLVFFTTASLLLLLQWAEKNFGWRHLALAGMCCGLAAGTKYNGLISIAVLSLLVPIVYQRISTPDRQSNTKSLSYAVFFFLTALLFFSPWPIRNYIWTGNPIYPLYNSVFINSTTSDSTISPQGSEEINVNDQQISPSSGNAFITRKLLYNEHWWQTLLLPIRMFFEGRDDDPRYFDGKLNPFLLCLPILVLFFKPGTSKELTESKLLLYFSILYFFFTFFQSEMRIRYITPIIPPLVILSIFGLHGLSAKFASRATRKNSNSNTGDKIALLLFIFILAFNSKYLVDQFLMVNPMPYLQGKVSRENYIRQYRPEFPAIQAANAHLSEKSRVLCIFLGDRGYYMDFQPIFEQPFSQNSLIATFLKESNSDIDILGLLERNKISHVMMRDDLTWSWFEQLSDKNKARVSPLFHNMATSIFRNNGHSFFSVNLKDN